MNYLGKKAIRLLTGCYLAAATFAQVNGSEKLKNDWLFQANNKPTLEAVKNEIQWARELASRISTLEGAPDLSSYLVELSATEKNMNTIARDNALTKIKVIKAIYSTEFEGSINTLDVTTKLSNLLKAGVAKISDYTRTFGNPNKDMKVPPPVLNWRENKEVRTLRVDYTFDGTEKTQTFSFNEDVNLNQHYEELYLAVRKIKRAITFKNPLINFDKVLLVDNPYPPGGTTGKDFGHESNHEARHRNGFMAINGGKLLVLNGLNPDSETTEIKIEEKRGAFWRPDISYDGKEILFCYKPAGEKSFHIYKSNIDGSNVRQLTFGDYDDLDPIFAPDGKINFTTTRAGTYVRCMPMTHVFVNARCDADGKNIYVLSRNNEPDFLPTVLDDGRIIYTRWEYTDKNLWRVQSLWTMNPDGTNVNVFWGNQSVYPDMLVEPRQIPGSNRIMFTGVGHHRWFDGSVGIIDPKKGLNFPHGLTKVTQDVLWPETGNHPEIDPVETTNYHKSGNIAAYKTPYPLSEEYFLVSARTGYGTNLGHEDNPPTQPEHTFSLYLMDVYGNKELIYKGEHNVWHAMPAMARKKPRVIPDVVDWPGTGKDHKGTKPGYLYSSNVLEGTKIPKEKAKYLRVIETPAKTYTTWEKTVLHDGPAVAAHGPDPVKRILGTVPIEKDGSVNIEVPAGKAFYFQILDEEFRCVKTMRSFTGVMPGETRGCVGCHEQQNTAPQSGGLALHKAPKKLQLPPWGTQTVGYDRFVQPTLEKYCGECHQGDKNPKARKALDLTYRVSKHRWWNRTPNHRPGELSPFPEPYLTLVGGSRPFSGRTRNIKGLISVSDDEFKIPTSIAGVLLHEGYGINDVEAIVTLPPMSTFTYKSKLYDYATSGKHHDVKIDEEAKRKLIVWIDTNGPFLGAEEIRNMYDPAFDETKTAIRPRIATAPIIDRFNIRQDGDSNAIVLGPLKLASSVAPSAAEPHPWQGKTIHTVKVTVLKATYGAEGSKIDVTDILSKHYVGRVAGGIARIVNYKKEFGDPAPGKKKELTVTYKLNNKEYTRSFDENNTIQLNR